MDSIFEIQEIKNYNSIYEDSAIDRAFTENNGDKIKRIKETLKVGSEIGKKAANIAFDGSNNYDPMDFKENFDNKKIDDIINAISSIESYRNLLITKKNKEGNE